MEPDDCQASRPDTAPVAAGTPAVGGRPAKDPRYERWRWIIFGITWLAYVGFYFTRKSWAVAKIGILKDPAVAISKSSLGWVDGVYGVAYAMGQFIWGMCGDKFGPRVVVLTGMFFSVLAAVAMGASSVLIAFGVFFFIQGLCQSSGWAPLTKNVSYWFSRKERGRVYGFWATNYAIGGMLASAFAGYMAYVFLNWRFAFFMPAAVLATIWVLFVLFQRNRPEDIGLPAIEDYHGEAVDVLDEHEKPEEEPEGSWTVIAEVFKNPIILTLGAVYFLLKPTRYAILFWGPLMINERLGTRIDQSAIISAAFELGGPLGVIFAGYASDKWFGTRRIPASVIGLLCLSVALMFFESFTAGIDSKYNGIKAVDIAVTSRDNDAVPVDTPVAQPVADGPSVTVTPSTGLVTTERGGDQKFTIVLNTPPTADVTIALRSSDTTEGEIKKRTPRRLTFTPESWNEPQTVTVTGLDDGLGDGAVIYTVVTTAASADIRYNGLDVADVSVTNQDDDITVTPTAGLVTTEGGGSKTFTVAMNMRPTADVTIALYSKDTTEGTVRPSSLTFTPGNWNTPQEVTVTGVDDDRGDGNVSYTIKTGAVDSEDKKYDGLAVADVSVTNQDDDAAGITVTPTAGVVTTEQGGSDTFTVVLNMRPKADVTIAPRSSDTTEGKVEPDTLTFTPDNWNTPQEVIVTGVDDIVDDGEVSYGITAEVTDADADTDYQEVEAAEVAAVNRNDDAAGITVTSTGGLVTTEGGGSVTYDVVLNTQPTAEVTVELRSSDDTEGTVLPSSLLFTPDNWDTPQTVTVTGVDDAEEDGDVGYTITTAAPIRGRMRMAVVLFVIGFFLFGPDALISSVAAVDFGTKKGAGSSAGLINGMGSTGQILGLSLPGLISYYYGWGVLFYCLGGFVLVAGLILLPLWNAVPAAAKKENNTSNNR